MDKGVSPTIEIKRESPSFGRAIAAHLFDYLSTLVTAFLLLFAFSPLLLNLPFAQEARSQIDATREESGLYKRVDGKEEEIVSILDEEGLSYNAKSFRLNEILSSFFSSNFFEEDELKSPEETYLLLLKESKGNEKEDLFGEAGERLFDSPDYDESYYMAYRNIASDFAPGYLGYKKGYLEARRTIILTQSFALLLSLFSSYALFLFAIPLIQHRGKQSLGMKINSLYYLESNGLSPSWGRYAIYSLFRFLFFFSFGMLAALLPHILSATMMGVRNSRQTLSEFVFSLFPVYAKKDEIYEKETEIAE